MRMTIKYVRKPSGGRCESGGCSPRYVERVRETRHLSRSTTLHDENCRCRDDESYCWIRVEVEAVGFMTQQAPK